MMKLSRSLLSRNLSSQTLVPGKWSDTGDALWSHAFESRAAISTSAHDFAVKGNSNASVFAPYTVFKGKAALSVSPLLPTFSKIDSGALKLDRRGAMMLTFWPAVAERKYDWEKRQKFALSPTEVGSLISMGAADTSEFFHDPSKLSSNAGQISKKLFIKAHDAGNGYMISLTVTNNILKSTDRLYVPVTTAEFAVLKTACSDVTVIHILLLEIMCRYLCEIRLSRSTCTHKHAYSEKIFCCFTYFAAHFFKFDIGLLLEDSGLVIRVCVASHHWLGLVDQSVRNLSSQTLLPGKWSDIGDALWSPAFESRAAITTSAHDFAVKGNSNARVFSPFTVYKGKAALSVSPLLPTFSKIDSGALKLDRRGAMMLTFWPAVAERKYDWEKRQKFALSPTEVGSLISMGAHDTSEFYHDPSKLSSNAGQIAKKLFIKAHDAGDGYMVSLTVTNNIQKSTDRFYVPVTTAEFAVLKTACSFALPHIIGWDWLNNRSGKGGIEGSSTKVEALSNEEEVELRSKIEALGLEVTKVPSKSSHSLDELEIERELDRLSVKLDGVDEMISSDPQVQSLLSDTAHVWMPVITANADERRNFTAPTISDDKPPPSTQ
ncbi:ssDNA-binding transcriptional regulator [Corchorus capsularis]|uniref:SsDNA-binding transcriptional regulator n=1 Tax=Corchorus capsularis TaxID=210143 RepID=A0A1R3G085_COCAP|nr:ssDNA-binding transcriptional regulator [Corchorus capsularis]